MKKALALLWVTCFIFALAACSETGNPDSDTTVDITPSQTAEATQTPESLGTAQPSATPVDYEETVKTVKLNEELIVHGVKITVTETIENDEAYIYAAINGNTIKLIDGEFDSATVYGSDSGEVGIIISSIYYETSTTKVYKVNDNNTVTKTVDMIGTVESVISNEIKMTGIINTIGTWVASREYTLEQGMKFEPKDSQWLILNTDEYRYMTLLCDIDALDVAANKEVTLEQGTKVAMYSTDNQTFAILKDVKTDTMYKIDIESNGFGNCKISNVNLPDYDCFENIMYAG